MLLRYKLSPSNLLRIIKGSLERSPLFNPAIYSQIIPPRSITLKNVSTAWTEGGYGIRLS